MTTTQARAPESGVAARSVAASALGGAASGFLVAGIGGRLAMRLSAQIDRSAHGLITENGEVVGEFTLAGTIAFVIFVGIFGAMMVGFLWALVAPWLPVRWGPRRVAAFILAAALGGRMAIDGTNLDFFILDPPLAQAAIYTALAGSAGLVAAVFEERFARRLPGPQPGITVGYWSVVPLGALIAIPFSGLFFTAEGCGCANPPWLVGVALVALCVGWIWRLVLVSRGKPEPDWLMNTGRALLVGISVAGLVHLGSEIAHFA